MYWDHIAKGWKQLFAKVALPLSTAPVIDAKLDKSVDSAPSRGQGYDAEPSTPYTPDGHRD